jgi:hypothetical protein
VSVKYRSSGFLLLCLDWHSFFFAAVFGVPMFSISSQLLLMLSLTQHISSFSERLLMKPGRRVRYWFIVWMFSLFWWFDSICSVICCKVDVEILLSWYLSFFRAVLHGTTITTPIPRARMEMRVSRKSDGVRMCVCVHYWITGVLLGTCQSFERDHQRMVSRLCTLHLRKFHQINTHWILPFFWSVGERIIILVGWYGGSINEDIHNSMLTSYILSGVSFGILMIVYFLMTQGHQKTRK